MTDVKNWIVLKMTFVHGSTLVYDAVDPSRDEQLKQVLDVLRKVDHEGSEWEVEETDSDRRVGWDITAEVERLYADARVDVPDAHAQFKRFVEHCRTGHNLPDICCPLLPEDVE